MKKPLLFVVLTIVVGAGGAMKLAWAQTPAPPAAPAPPVALPSGVGSIPRTDPADPDEAPAPQFFYDARRPVPNGLRAHRRDRVYGATEMKAMAKAVEKLKTAKEGPEKEAATKELTQQLEKSFARDLERREKEVTEIEGRVKKLRDQIEKRKKAKDEIVSLRLKTIINETEGLGFPGPVGFDRAEPFRGEMRPGQWPVAPGGMGGIGGGAGIGIPPRFDFSSDHPEPSEQP